MRAATQARPVASLVRQSEDAVPFGVGHLEQGPCRPEGRRYMGQIEVWYSALNGPKSDPSFSICRAQRKTFRLTFRFADLSVVGTKLPLRLGF